MGYHQRRALQPSAHLSFIGAGHILGSASALITIGADTILFSGDLGRTRHPLLLAREAPPGARTVVIESTYGDRAHPADGVPTHEILAAAICRTVKRSGSVLVPAPQGGSEGPYLHLSQSTASRNLAYMNRLPSTFVAHKEV